MVLVALAMADYTPEPYRINFGVVNYTRLIDEFAIVSPAQRARSVRLNFDYPGGVSMH